MSTTTSDTCGAEEAAGAVRPSAAKAGERAMDSSRKSGAGAGAGAAEEDGRRGEGPGEEGDGEEV